MNGLTEEEYELELLGIGQEDDNEANSDDERYEIEEALYQSMHYAESIVAKKNINESEDKPIVAISGSQVLFEKSSGQQSDTTEGVVATDNNSSDSHQSSNITKDDSENSKYCLENTSKKSIKSIDELVRESSECESATDMVTLTFPNEQNVCVSNKNNVLEDPRKLINESNNEKSSKDNDSDYDACCILIESASEDENLQVHFASKKQKDVSSPNRTAAARKVTRYFEEPSSKHMTVKCYNCKQNGHYMSDCPEDKKPVACIMCGLQGHYYKHCPNQLCFNCDLPGHENKTCTKKRIHWNTVCKRCYMPGHEMKTCADRWRQFHLTTKSKPKLLYGADENMKQTYCYNCGKEGHLGYECRADRMERYVKVNYPFICNYSYKKYTCMAFTRLDNHPEKTPTIPLESDPPELAKIKKKKKKEKLVKTDDEAETDLQITFSKAGKKRKIKCKKDEEDRIENSTEAAATSLQITVSKSKKKRKIKHNNDEEIDVMENSKETKDIKKKKKKSKKMKNIETQTNPDAENIETNTGIENMVTETKAATESKKEETEGKPGAKKETEGKPGAKKETEGKPGAKKDKTVDTNSPTCITITDDEVIVLKTVKKRKIVNDEDVIVLSSDVDACKDQPDVITISDSSEDGTKQSKKRKVVVCDDQDVIVLSDEGTNAEERNPRSDIQTVEINGDDNDDSRTPFALVWGLPTAVCNTIKPISNKIKKMFRKNMRKNNLPQEFKKKKKKKPKQSNGTNNINDSVPVPDFQGSTPKRRRAKKKKFLKLIQGKGEKKSPAESPMNVPSFKVQFSNETNNPNRFVSMNANTSKYKWNKKNNKKANMKMVLE